MADPAYTAIQTERALNRIVEVVPELLARFGVDPVEIPTWGRDLNYLHMEQMQALAANLDRLLTVTAPPEDLTTLTKAQLVERLAALGVTGVDKDAHKKDDLIAMVQAHEQPADDPAVVPPVEPPQEEDPPAADTPEETPDGNDPADE